MNTAEDHSAAPPGRAPRLLLALVVGTWLLVLAVAFVTRSANHEAVFRSEGVVFFGNDAYYHMRRIQHALETEQGVPRHDALLHHPDGAESIWPPAFDAATATVFDVVGLDGRAAEVAAAWVPVALALLALLAVGLAARGLGLPRGTGLLAAAALAVLPAHVHRTLLGFLDHHAALGLLTALFLAAGGGVFRAASSPRRRLLAHAGMALVLGGSVLLWPGCLLFAAIHAVAIVVAAWLRPERAVSLAGFSTLVFLAGAVLIHLGVQASGGAGDSWSLTTLSAAHAGVFVVIALTLLAVALAATTEPAGRAVAIVAFTIPLLCVGGGALLVEDVRTTVFEAWRWLAKREEFQSAVTESAPLFELAAGWSGNAGVRNFSFAVYALPLVCLGLALASWRRRDPARAFLGIATAGFFGVTLVQQRFVDFSAAPVAICIAMAVTLPVARIPGPTRAVAGVVALAALGAALIPCARVSGAPVRRAYVAWRDGGTALTVQDQVQLERYRMALWLREHSTPSPAFADPQAVVDEGVLCPWVGGHILQYVARQPCVVDNFGDDLGGDHYTDAERFFRTEDLDEAEALLRRYRVRYVVTEPPPTMAQLEGSRLGVRLHFFGGSGFTAPGTDTFLPGVGFLRLLRESERLPAAGLPVPPQRLFEFVEGAVLVGPAPPGAMVVARLHVKTNLGRPVTAELGDRQPFELRTVAGADGRFALRVPYATTGFEHQAVPAGPLQLFNGVTRTTMDVPEIAVREGRTLEVTGF